MQERLRADVVEATPEATQQDFVKFMEAEIALWTRVVKAGKITLE